MTDGDAFRKAKKLWGRVAAWTKKTQCSMYKRRIARVDGHIDEIVDVCRDHGIGCKGGRQRRQIGRKILGGEFYELLGQGDSWEEAFQDYESKHPKIPVDSDPV